MAEREKVILRNATTRPVEVHFPERVLVLAPRQAFELTEPNATCDVLEKRGVLTRHVIREAVPDASPADARAGTASAPGRTRPERRSAARRTPAVARPTEPGDATVKGDSE